MEFRPVGAFMSLRRRVSADVDLDHIVSGTAGDLERQGLRHGRPGTRDKGQINLRLERCRLPAELPVRLGSLFTRQSRRSI